MAKTQLGHMVTPVQFGTAVNKALSFMSQGSSISAACIRACRAEAVDEAWTIPMIGFIQSSPTTAEAWARVQFAAALDRKS